MENETQTPQEQPSDESGRIWEYDKPRATLKRFGIFFAMVTPDGRNEIDPMLAEELIKTLNDGETKEDHDAFLAFMADSLAQFPCCCDEGKHDGTPPMLWPELIACIARRSAQDAVKGVQSTRNSQPSASLPENIKTFSCLHGNQMDTCDICNKSGAAAETAVQEKESTTEKWMNAFAEFRREIRQVLHEKGLFTNPGSDDADLIAMIRTLETPASVVHPDTKKD